MAGRPRYTPDELGQYFDRIGLPRQHRALSVQAPPLRDHNDLRLAHLALLLKHHLVRVPFENLTQHYSWHGVVDVSPRHVFRKIVLGHGHGHGSNRGGYCMEANSLFHTVLLSLGYDVYIAGARIYDATSQRYGGFTHCVNIVTIAGARYMVDVGFGANGPTRPVPLRSAAAGAGAGAEAESAVGEHLVIPQIAPASVRLLHEPIPQQTNQGCRVWIYQHRIDARADWVPMYCFVDFEFLLEDIRGMNLSPWRSPHSWFTRKIVTVRFTTDREVLLLPPSSAEEIGDAGGGGWLAKGGATSTGGDEGAVVEGEIDGAIILFEGTLKWRRGGETKLEIQFKSEGERLEALERCFGIVFDEEDRDAIRGTVSEISDTS
ncbi:hypothetical protein SLS62_004686 [Diatrype stigma]|uniref:Arylamine N-acetyltransferase n=1 Tax=Diatrype stigma TaxID=117547 RepID=A0AAN9YQD3_9PEZI